MSTHDRIITPDTDPDRFTAGEKAYFRDGKCGMTTGYGLPWTEHCGQPSEPGASFGSCAEHNAELLEEFYPDGTRRPVHRCSNDCEHAIRAVDNYNQRWAGSRPS